MRIRNTRDGRETRDKMYTREYQIFLRKRYSRLSKRYGLFFTGDVFGKTWTKSAIVSNLNEFVYQIHFAKLITSRESFSFAEKCGASDIFSACPIRANEYPRLLVYIWLFEKYSKSFSLWQIIWIKIIRSDNMSQV